MSEPSVSDLLTVQQAIEIIDVVPVAPKLRRDGAFPLGQVLAKDIVADRDYPPFDKALMDGYAVCRDGGRTFRLIGEVAAGDAFTGRLQPGQAVAIMTGAPMPAGADAIVPVEDAVEEGSSIRATADLKPGRYIAQRGSDCPAGQVVLRAGQRMGPAHVAIAEAVGVSVPPMFEPPLAAVLTTGNEVVNCEPGPTEIRNSNGPMLLALLLQLGCNVDRVDHVADDPALIRTAIEERIVRHDLLFVTGGMSMGKYDYIPRILKEAGFTLHVTKLRIKPGKPFVFASRGGKFVFGLPGNPVSAFVCTLRLASRLIDRMTGLPPAEPWIEAELESPLPANGPREFYQPAKLVQTTDGFPRARPLQWKGSADIFTLAEADALLVRPENEPQRSTGSRVRLLEVPR